MNKVSECKNVSLLLSEYLDNQLDEGTVFQVSAHLTECKSCYTEFENLSSVREMVKETYQQTLNSINIDIASMVMARVNATSTAIGKTTEPKMGRYFIYAATTLLIIFSTIIFAQNKNKELLADKSKFNTYAMEHANTIHDDIMVRGAQLSNVSVTVGK